MCVDRFPARPYILEGHPTNKTAIVNGNVTFTCPVIADIAAHITWAKYLAFNDTDDNFKNMSNTLRLEVYGFIFVGVFYVVLARYNRVLDNNSVSVILSQRNFIKMMYNT